MRCGKSCERAHKPVVYALLQVALLWFLSPANAAEEIGSAVKISNRVVGALGEQERPLSKGSAVFYKERLSATSGSSGQFVLKDGTKFALGSRASLVLDDVVFKGNRKRADRVWLRLLKGALRFASGRSAKKTYRINAAAATLGVRGTMFDVYTRSGRTFVVLLRGRMRVCTRDRRGRRRCRNLRRACEWVSVGRRGTLRRSRGLRRVRPLGTSRNRAFPFLRGDRRLIPGLRAGGEWCLSYRPRRATRRPPPPPFYRPGDPAKPGWGFLENPEGEGGSLSGNNNPEPVSTNDPPPSNDEPEGPEDENEQEGNEVE